MNAGDTSPGGADVSYGRSLSVVYQIVMVPGSIRHDGAPEDLMVTYTVSGF